MKIGRRALAILEYKKSIPVDIWAEENYVLESDSAVGGGKFNFKYAPHLRKPLNLLSDNSLTEYTFWFASQSGKTTVAMVHMNYMIDIEPSNFMFFLPNDNAISYTATDRILPAIKRTKNAQSLLEVKEQNKAKENTKNIRFVGGVGRILGANSKVNRKSMPSKVIYLDEIAEFEHLHVKQIIERAKTFSAYGKKIIKTSTSIYKNDPIVKSYEESQLKYEYYSKCPACEKEHVDDFVENFKHPKTEDKYLNAREAVYVCPHCKAEWDNNLKKEAVENGGWKLVSGNPKKAKTVGLRASSFVSHLVSIEDLALEWLDAEGDEELEEAVYNGWFSKIYEREEKTTKADEILTLKNNIPKGIVPKDTVAMFGAIDVQKDHFYFVVVAVNEYLSVHIVDYGRLETEADKERKVLQNYYDADGELHLIETWADDSGYNKDFVYEFCRKMSNLHYEMEDDPSIQRIFDERYGEALNVIPIKGASRSMSTISQITSLETDENGKKYEDSLKLHVINTEMFKDRAQRYIDESLSDEYTGKRLLTLHEEAEDSIAEALTSEIKKEVVNAKKQISHAWTPKKSHPFNHYWDCLYIVLYLIEKNEVRFRKYTPPEVNSPEVQGVKYNSRSNTMDDF